MNTRRRTVAALTVALAAVVGGCADHSNQSRPTVTVPATLAAQSPTPTSPARAFTPAPIPTGRPGMPAGGLPPPSTITSSDPDVAAVAALTAYYGADTALDLSPADTHRRALPWTTGQLAAAITADRPIAAPGATWNTWAAHRAYTTVTATRAYDDGAPAETPTTAYRQYVITVTLHGRDRWTGPAVGHTDFLVLHRTGNGWRITNLAENR